MRAAALRLCKAEDARGRSPRDGLPLRWDRSPSGADTHHSPARSRPRSRPVARAHWRLSASEWGEWVRMAWAGGPSTHAGVEQDSEPVVLQRAEAVPAPHNLSPSVGPLEAPVAWWTRISAFYLARTSPRDRRRGNGEREPADRQSWQAASQWSQSSPNTWSITNRSEVRQSVRGTGGRG